MTPGGDGNSNPSEETRRKMSKSQTGENNGFYGKTHTEEAKANFDKINLLLVS